MPVTNYFWDMESDNVLMEKDETGATTAVYTNEPELYGKLLSQHRDGETYFHHYDGGGDTRVVTDENENVVEAATYSAFGEVVEKTSSIANPFGYKGALGYYTNAETNDIYVRARSYMPRIARWLSEDPLGFGDSSNPFLYAWNNPLGTNDPSGLFCSVAESEVVFRRPYQPRIVNGILRIKSDVQYYYRFNPPCCFRCEFRQKLRGFVWIRFNDGPKIFPPLGGGHVPNPNEGLPVEDCFQHDDGNLECAGHRNLGGPARFPGPPHRLPLSGFFPDEWGCEFYMYDAPGITIDLAGLKRVSGNIKVKIEVNISLDFIQEIIDTCDNNHVVEWDDAQFRYNGAAIFDLGRL